jgi:hypothetical protein
MKSFTFGFVLGVATILSGLYFATHHTTYVGIDGAGVKLPSLATSK